MRVLMVLGVLVVLAKLRFAKQLAGAPPCLRRAPHRYGNATFTLKNLWAELVGDCHAATVTFVLPWMTVLTL